MMNNELRDAAVRAISNYIHQELFEITQSADMLPFIKDQAESIIISIDKSIASIKIHPLAKVIK